MKEFMAQIANPPTKIMLIGPVYTPEAKVLAETAPLFSLVQVRISSTHCAYYYYFFVFFVRPYSYIHVFI